MPGSANHLENMGRWCTLNDESLGESCDICLSIAAKRRYDDGKAAVMQQIGTSDQRKNAEDDN